MLKVKYLKCLALTLLLIALTGHSYEWSDLSQEDYINNLITCQNSLNKVEWENSLWPEVNAAPKPLYSERLAVYQAPEKVIKNLKMQSILLTKFGLEITKEMLQVEIDRVSKNTKNPVKLQSMYAALNNDPQNVAHCIARPSLVKRLLRQKYGFNHSIHKNLYTQAQIELKQYQESGKLNKGLATINKVTYRLTNEFENSDKHQELNVIELDFLGFQDKKKDLYAITGLQENSTSYYFSKLINRKAHLLQVESIIWQKESYDNWLLNLTNKTSMDQLKLPAVNTNQLLLTKISNRNVIVKSAALLAMVNTWSNTSTSGSAPSGRYYHTAIWTGNHMIVWGGTGAANNTYENTGGLYDPALDSWSSTTTTAAPIARQQHTAIWTGTEMIVWGGYFFNGSHNYESTGARYDPVDNDWVAITQTDVPVGRIQHSAIWSGTEMIIWGGYYFDGSVHFENTGARYNPTSGWIDTTTANAPAGRREHTVVWNSSASEMIVWGGYYNDGANQYVNTGGRYNVATGWTPTTTSNAPTGRYRHSVVWTGSEMVVWAGNNAGAINNTGGRYNPNSGWIDLPTNGAPSERSFPTAVWTGSEMIVWGGLESGSVSANTGGHFDINSGWTATETNNAPIGRYYHTAVWADNVMIIWGDRNKTGTGGVYFEPPDLVFTDGFE